MKLDSRTIGLLKRDPLTGPSDEEGSLDKFYARTGWMGCALEVLAEVQPPVGTMVPKDKAWDRARVDLITEAWLVID